jgi:Tfp pilus assembly protein PilN
MTQQINLFRPQFRKQRELLSAATLAAAVLLVAAGTLGYAGYAKRELTQAEQRVAQADAGLKQMRERLASLGAGPATAGPGKALLDELARAEARVKTRQELIDTLKGGGIGSAEGFSRYLAALARQRAEGVWLTGIKVGGAGAEFTLQGRALRADLLPGYIRLLNSEETLRGKQIGQMSLREKEEEAAVPAAPRAAPPERPARERLKARYVEFTIGSGATGGAGG